MLCVESRGHKQPHHTHRGYIFLFSFSLLSRGDDTWVRAWRSCSQSHRRASSPPGAPPQPLFPLLVGRHAAVHLAVGGVGPDLCLGALAGAVADLRAVLQDLPIACEGKHRVFGSRCCLQCHLQAQALLKGMTAQAQKLEGNLKNTSSRN